MWHKCINLPMEPIMPEYTLELENAAIICKNTDRNTCNWFHQVHVLWVGRNDFPMLLFTFISSLMHEYCIFVFFVKFLCSYYFFCKSCRLMLKQTLFSVLWSYWVDFVTILFNNLITVLWVSVPQLLGYHSF